MTAKHNLHYEQMSHSEQTLNHEIWDNAMESGLLVVHLFPGHGADSLLTGAQTTEVLSGSRGNAIVQFEYHPSHCCAEEHVQILAQKSVSI